MNEHSLPRMNVDEFLPWAERQPKGRYELFGGQVAMQQAERWAHVALKGNIYYVLRNVIARAGVPFYAAIDGQGIRIAEDTCYEPDVLIARLPEPESNALEIQNPIVVVEVLSPSSVRIDLSVKLAGYAKVASIRHYLVIDPDKRTVARHRREPDGGLAPPGTVRDGAIRLDEVGVEIEIAELFNEA